MQLQINENKKELKSHGSYEFPIYISDEVLSLYEKGSFLWHWHSEIELTYIIEGKMHYQVNETTYELSQGEGLFCNANALHTGHRIGNSDCKYISITFHPRLIYGFDTSLIKTKYIDQLLNSPDHSSVHLKKCSPWQNAVLEGILRIEAIARAKDPFFELQIQCLLTNLFLEFFSNTRFDANELTNTRHINTERIKSILSYIHDHYADRLSLEAIASHVNICKSECCRFFKSTMSESIFDYILSYRIEKSLPLLMDSSNNITEIASLTGFPSPSYYSKIFNRHMGCTPKAYRKLHRLERSLDSPV